MNGVGNGCSSWLRGAEWPALRTIVSCESVVWPLWDLPGLTRRTGWDMVATGESKRVGLCTEPPRDSAPRGAERRRRARGRVQALLPGGPGTS